MSTYREALEFLSEIALLNGHQPYIDSNNELCCGTCCRGSFTLSYDIYWMIVFPCGYDDTVGQFHYSQDDSPQGNAWRALVQHMKTHYDEEWQ